MIKEGMFVRCPIDREYPYDPMESIMIHSKENIMRYLTFQNL